MISALAPLAQDVVITGHDRDEIGVLVFPTADATALHPTELAQHIGNALTSLRSGGAGSSQAPTRALVLAEPPNADAGEITDKGYINQSAVLKRRTTAVAQLHAGGPGVILPC